eukprot:TRINITY_DN1050_c0_g2_i1.p1 TRINITY_DN1050_c0_g2~~TRINITY_DN1050_c0_g2_i1.p1  ORF type:complete len:725 (-),score=207.85 TRINITY_DN1050_c0_g2_i1:153-2327(-)
MEIEPGSQGKDPNQQKKEEELANLVKSYFTQLSNGCGRADCINQYCASCVGARKYKIENPNERAVAALQLAAKHSSQTEFLCTPLSAPQSKEPPFLDLETVQKLVSDAKETQQYTMLVRTVYNVFSSSEALSNSFILKPYPISENLAPYLDMDQLREAWRLLMEVKDAIIAPLTNALQSLFTSYRFLAKNFNSMQSVRQFIILLEFPKLLDPSFHKEVAMPVCATITKLNLKLCDLLTTVYFEKFDNEKLRVTHQGLQDVIALRLVNETGNQRYRLNSDEGIIGAVKLISFIHKVNEKRHVIRYDQFYNELLNDTIDLRDDFTNWKRDNGFSFISTPFILTPEVKSKVILIESIVNQRRRRVDAFQEMMMGVMTSPFLELRVRREHLIEDSLSQLSAADRTDLVKELKVQFVGEEGIDEGGVSKEWFQLIVKEIFDPKYGMFIEDEVNRLQWFNSASRDFPEFELTGILLGLAIYNGVILDMHLPVVVYKKLLGLKLSLEDVKQVNPGLYRGLKQLNDYDGDVEDLDLTFQIVYDFFGQNIVHNLLLNGANIPVTNDNKQQYIDLYVQYLLEESVKQQFDWFLKGFRHVMQTDLASLFLPEELELLVCGDPSLDFEALEREGTLYDNGFTPEHQTVKDFWEIVHSFTLEQKKRLLFFTTGSDRAPIGGLSKLKLILARNGPDSDRLPTSHTCFNHLLLPEYSSKEKLRDYLLKAISNAEGFGLR